MRFADTKGLPSQKTKLKVYRSRSFLSLARELFRFLDWSIRPVLLRGCFLVGFDHTSAFLSVPAFPMNTSNCSQHRYDRQPAARRVVITGIGAVCAGGNSAPALWQSLLQGRSGIGPITRFDSTGLESTIAGEVKNFDPTRLIEPRLKPKRLARQAQFAVVAAAEAVRDAGLTAQALLGRKVGIVIGSSVSSLESVAESALRVHEKGPGHAIGMSVLACNMQGSALAVADLLQLDQAMAMMVSTACASGVDAVRISYDLLRSGRFDLVICGGTDAPVSKTPCAEFSMIGMNSRRNDEPEKAVRPFDRESDDSLIAEGGAILVLEDNQAAADRGATAYVEILGADSALDPKHSGSGSGLELSMRGALENASCTPKDIDFISAWGCGNPNSDRVETQCIKRVFGEHAYDLAVGSIKGVTGLPLGAAGVLQIVSTALSHRHHLLPPTLNSENGHVDLDLDYVRGKARRIKLRKSLINAHGMGGNNVSLVLSQPR